MFETDEPGWEYATHGGTAFVVRWNGAYYGITCKHCLGDFNWRRLALTDAKFGKNAAGLSAIYYPSNPVDGAIDSDILDIAVVQFATDSGAEFFQDRAYIIDDDTVATSKTGDKLHTNGALKDKSEIGEQTISPQFALLEFEDRGPSVSDPTLREAYAEYADIDFGSLTGLSGSPVFNITQRKLTGVVVRGSLIESKARMRYVDIADILQILRAISSNQSQVRYNKTLLQISQPSRKT